MFFFSLKIENCKIKKQKKNIYVKTYAFISFIFLLYIIYVSYYCYKFNILVCIPFKQCSSLNEKQLNI